MNLCIDIVEHLWYFSDTLAEIVLYAGAYVLNPNNSLLVPVKAVLEYKQKKSV